MQVDNPLALAGISMVFVAFVIILATALTWTWGRIEYARRPKPGDVVTLRHYRVAYHQTSPSKGAIGVVLEPPGMFWQDGYTVFIRFFESPDVEHMAYYMDVKVLKRHRPLLTKRD